LERCEEFWKKEVNLNEKIGNDEDDWKDDE
jgi:hypothetical protein